MHVNPLMREVSQETRFRDAPCKPATIRLAAMFSADILGLMLSAAVAFIVHMAVGLPSSGRALQQITDQGFSWQGWGTILIVALLVLYFGIRGHYTSRVPIWTELRGLFLGVILGFLCDGYIRVVVYGSYAGLESVIRWAILIPCLLFMRNLARAILDDLGLWRLRTLIIGDDAAVAPTQAAFLSEPRLGYEVVASIGLKAAAAAHIRGRGARLLEQHGAEFAVVAIGGDVYGEAARIAEDLSRERVPFALVPAIDGLPVSAFSSHYFFTHDVMLLVYGNNLARPISRVIKTLFDQFVALLLLVGLSPLFLALAVLVRADGGSVLFGHKRLGENGRHFRCLKFRSMVPDADTVLHQVLTTDSEAQTEWDATHKLHDDPRITPIGRILRKTSIDELPQLLNVLRGEMSLVGPRPIIDAEVPRYGRDISYYFEAKPGITGLWQVSGRSNTTYDYRVRLDVWYVRNWSLWHDIAILMKTLPAVLRKEGAV
jgi:Undecaprenyl-phosphate galactose phosphotransferase WbaP